MKLRNLIPLRYRTKLVKLPNGQHELIGGSAQDRTAAFEWASLFAHEIVFTHFYHKEPEPKFLNFPIFLACVNNSGWTDATVKA